MSEPFTRTKLPTPSDIANSGLRYTIDYSVKGYYGKRLISVEVDIERWRRPGNRLKVELKQRSAAFAIAEKNFDTMISSVEAYHLALQDAIDVTKDIKNMLPEAEEILEEIIQLETKKQQEYEIANQKELEKDETFGIKEARRLVKEMHAKAKTRKWRDPIEKYVFVPAGLDKLPFYVTADKRYTMNVFFTLDGYKIRREEVTRRIAHASKAKTMFARLSQ